MTDKDRTAIKIYAPVDKIAYLLEYIDSMLEVERSAGRIVGYEDGYKQGRDDAWAEVKTIMETGRRPD